MHTFSPGWRLTFLQQPAFLSFEEQKLSNTDLKKDKDLIKDVELNKDMDLNKNM